jgi:hypothetical protein
MGFAMVMGFTCICLGAAGILDQGAASDMAAGLPGVAEILKGTTNVGLGDSADLFFKQNHSLNMVGLRKHVDRLDFPDSKTMVDQVGEIPT